MTMMATVAARDVINLESENKLRRKAFGELPISFNPCHHHLLGYVVSSIILVAEPTFATMKEDNVDEVSFTGLATKAFGSHAGSSIALVYASLSFSLLVAIDVANRFLCFLMLFSLTTLVAIGLSVGRTYIMGSFAYASWGLSSVLPAIRVTVLTLGFHVISPFVCKISGNTVNDARKAIFIGGFVPLVMVLSWNLIVLGLSGTHDVSSSGDPMSLLLSISSASLALATSFIGYAVSFPKQVVDTLELIFGKSYSKQTCNQSGTISVEDGVRKVGFVTYSGEHYLGNVGRFHMVDQGKFLPEKLNCYLVLAC
ncbi:unnamed protein product [Ilex paraguariensis]|uniref:Uncharacterized protein n=1 Tax=Ilex paraguariensis TaxID=185542 RepID=A0ABC8UW03_9AQUA